MARRLTDKEKQKIIADYVSCGNYSEVGRMNKVADVTVKAIVKQDNNVLRKLEQKREENTKDMMQYLDNNKEKAFNFLDMAFEELATKEKLKKAPLNQIATAMGIIIDKYAPIVNEDKNSVDNLSPAIEMLKGIKDEND